MSSRWCPGTGHGMDDATVTVPLRASTALQSAVFALRQPFSQRVVRNLKLDDALSVSPQRSEHRCGGTPSHTREDQEQEALESRRLGGPMRTFSTPVRELQSIELPHASSCRSL